MEDLATSTSHNHFAGRTPAGSQQPVTLGKNGVKHVSKSREDEKREALLHWGKRN
jgi:hypothetical protein